MRKFGKAGSTLATVLAAAIVLAIVSTTGAVAGSLITSKQIKNNTIKSKDVKDNNLKGVDISDGSLTGADIADASVGAADLAGDSVTSSKIGTIVERSESVVVANNDSGFAQVSCLAGETLLGGGASASGVGIVDGWDVVRSSKVGTNGWDAAVYNTKGSSGTLIVEAYCLQ